MIAQFVEVWTSISGYLVELFPQVTELFYTPGTDGGAGSLTFVGVMAVIMAGIALILLVFNLIRSFFAMRG
jgi:hypothetical protein